MAAHEGSRRIKLVGKFFIVFGGLLALVSWLFALSRDIVRSGPLPLSGYMVLLVFAGTVIWLVGWITEGFSDRTA